MADEDCPQAEFMHSRRGQKAPKQKSMASKPDYHWCTYANSTHLNTFVLPYLEPHLVVAAAKYRMVIDPGDLAWLSAHQGRFMHFIHPQSKEYRSILQLKKYVGKSTSFVKEDVLNTRHSVVAVSPRFRGKKLAPNYLNNQEKWLGMLWNFLAIIGDYESMLILLVKPPQNCPSVKFASTQGFVLHKFNVPLQPLCYSWEGGDPILDRNQVPILSEGAVDNSTWMQTLFAALNYLHPRNAKGGETQEYSPTCEACYLIYFDQSAPGVPPNERVSQYTPCPSHTDSPCRYCNRGNPYYKSSSLLINLTAYLKDESRRRQYTERSKDALLPSDVLDIHAYVKSCHFRTWDFANYTMCLGGIYYAGRFDSYSEVKLEDFSNASHHFSIHNNHIEHIAQQVFGKSDKGWHTYLLKFQDHCPELCYLRHLLVFVHCMNLLDSADSTNIFPSKATLMAHTSSSPTETYTGDVSYLEGLDWLKKRVMENVTNPMLDVGMHSLRVTFYLWAVLCNTPRQTMKKNARHKSEEMVDKYEANAQSVRSTLLKNPAMFAKQRLGPPQEVLLVSGEANQSIRVNLMCGSNNQVPNLPEVAKLFVEKMLHVPSTDSRYRNPSHLLELSYGKTFNGGSPADQHSRSLVESLPTEWRYKVAEAMSVVQSMPPELRFQVADAFNFPLSTPPTIPFTLPLGFGGAGHFAGNQGAFNTPPLPTPGHQPAVFPSTPPFSPRVLELVPSTSKAKFGSPPVTSKYCVPLKTHRFGKMASNKQCLFLYHVVEDLISLGKLASPTDCEQGTSNHLAAQLYFRGKSFVPQKSSFCRFVDPFFECLQGCCSFDIALFQSKHPDFKASVFKSEQQCVECKGLLENQWK
jgi:hypothetical protein